MKTFKLETDTFAWLALVFFAIASCQIRTVNTCVMLHSPSRSSSQYCDSSASTAQSSISAVNSSGRRAEKRGRIAQDSNEKELPKMEGISLTTVLRLDDRSRSDASRTSSPTLESRTSSISGRFWENRCLCGWSALVQCERRRRRPLSDLQRMRPYSNFAISS